MAAIQVAQDFREFLSLLDSKAFVGREVADLGGLPVPLIGLEQLKFNKAVAGRYQDLNELERLPLNLTHIRCSQSYWKISHL